MRRRRWLTLVSGIFVIVVAFFIMFSSPPTSYMNSGKLVFGTEQEYEQFKWDIAQDGIDIRKLNVLASSPPIIVDYSVVRDAEVLFPYGKEFVDAYDGAGVCVGLSALGIAIFTVGLFAFGYSASE